MIRDRFACWVCNLVLNHIASKHYRDMIGGSIRYGLRAAVEDDQASSPAGVVPRPLCTTCDRGNPVAVEIHGRVLVCAECATDPELLEHAEEDFR